MQQDRMQQTLVICKPDAVQRRLVGEIISRIERKGLTIRGLRLAHITDEQARELYAEHKGKAFHDPLVRFIKSGPAVLMVVEGPRAIPSCRELLGATFGFEAKPGTIRGDFGSSKSYNLSHASATLQEALREVRLFFRDEELVSSARIDLDWIYHTDDVE